MPQTNTEKLVVEKHVVGKHVVRKHVVEKHVVSQQSDFAFGGSFGWLVVW